ncbi:MAG: addiction module protein [Pseudoxanthomonas sp.]
MTTTLELLEARVMELSKTERAQLLDKLISSLDRDEEIEREWDAEADRREAMIESGEATWLSHEEVMANLQALLPK